MSTLNITRPPQFTDPWFAEIEQVWDELELAINDIEGRVVTLETQIVSDVVTSISKSGSPQLTGDVVLTQSGSISLTQVGNTIDIGGGGVTDHGALTGLLDDDHTQYLLANGSRSLGGNWSVGNYQLLSVRMENLAADPVAGNQGRLIFNTTSLQLKVDNGTSFVNVGVTDHGLLTGLGDDDHLQYLLVDGTRAVTGDFTVNGKYKNELAEPFLMESQEDNAGSPVAFILDTASNLITVGAKLLSVRNAGVEKFYIDKDGNVSLPLITSTTSAYALIDTDNTSSTEIFSVRMDDPDPSSATELFQINESGNAQLLGSLKVGGLSVAADPLDVTGNVRLTGELRLYGTGLIASDSSLSFKVDDNNDEAASFAWLDGTGASLMTLDEAGLLSVLGDLSVSGDINVTGASRIQSPGNLIFKVDSDNNEASSFNWENGAGASIMTLNESGDLTIAGIFTGGSSPFRFRSVEADGATAVAYELDTQVALSTAGAKLFVLKNFGVEKFAIDKDGIIVTGGGLTSATSVAAYIDNDNNSTSETFTIYHNTASPNPGDELFQVRENGEVEIYGGPLIGGSSPFIIKTKEANGASAIGFQLETNNALTTDGSSVFEVRNAANKLIRFRRGNNLRGQADNTLFEFYDKDGVRQRQMSAYFSGLQDQIQDFIVAGRHIVWHSNDFSEGNNSESVFIDSNIDATSATLELSSEALDGSGNFAGWANVTVDASQAGGGNLFLQAYDDAGDAIDFNITTEDQSALSLTTAKAVFNVNGSPALAIADNGDVAIGGTLIGGSSPFRLRSRETNSGSAIGFELNTLNTLSTSGAKLLSLKNNGVEVFSVDKDGKVSGGEDFVTVVLPSEGLAGIQSAINAANSAGGGIVQLLKGTYSGAPFTVTDINNVTVQGVGDATILEHDNSSAATTMTFAVSSAPFYAGNAVTTGDSSVFTTVAANAGNFLAGDMLTIEGTDAESLPDYEVHEVLANGNAGTGEITLKGRVKLTLSTSVFLIRGRHNRNNKIKDMKFTVTGANGIGAIYYTGGVNSVMENLLSVGVQGANTTPFQFVQGGGTHYLFGYKNTIRGCRVTEYAANAIGLHNQQNGLVEKCHVYNGGLVATRFNEALVIGDNIRDCKFSDNVIENLIGGMAAQSAVNFRRRIQVSNNRAINCYHGGIAILDGTECTISNNYIERCGKGSGSGFYPGILVGELASGKGRCIISDNYVKMCKIGITVASAGPDCIVSNNLIDGTITTDEAMTIDAHHTICTGNTIRNSAGYGIYVARKGTVCSNNTVRDCANAGILVVTDSGVISGNTTQGNSGSGISVSNSALDTIIIGNNCNGDGITMGTGTGNDFIGNKS